MTTSKTIVQIINEWLDTADIAEVGKCYRGTYYSRLIDALYYMVVKLKGEGVI